MMNYTELKSIILSLGYVSTDDPEAIREGLMTPSIQKYRPLTGDDLMLWAAGNESDYLALEQSAANGVHLSRIAMKLLDDSQRTLNISRPDVQMWMTGLLQMGVLTQVGHDAFYAIGVQEVSPAVFHNLGNVNIGDIQNAWAEG